MEKILNKIEEGILIIDEMGRVAFCNYKLLGRLGYTEEELKQKDISELTSFKKTYIEELSQEVGKTLLIELGTQAGQSVYLSGEILLKEWEGKWMYCIFFKSCDEVAYTREDLKVFLDQIDMNAWIKDLEGNYIYINKLGESHMREYGEGDEKEQLIGKSDRQVWQRASIESVKEPDEWVIEHKQPKSYEYEVAYKNEIETLSIYKTPILDEKGEVKYIAGVSRNITFRKKIQKELDEIQRKFFMFNTFINHPKTEEERYNFLKNIQEMLMGQLKADGSVIGLFDKSQNEIKHYFALGTGKKTLKNIENRVMTPQAFQKLLENSDNWGIKSREWLESKKKLTNVVELSRYGIKYIGCYPLVYDEELLGYITFGYKDESALKFNEDEFVRGICSQMAILIKNYNLSQVIQKELFKRKETELELEFFLDVATDMMAVIEEDGTFIKINSGWPKILGWSEEEIIGNKWQTITHPEDLYRTLRAIESNKHGKKFSGIVNRYRCKNGEYKWVEWTSRYIQEEKIFVCATRDLTQDRAVELERKEYQEALENESIKNEFLSNMSHEFKTPLNIILAMMQLIDKSIEDKSIQINEGINLTKYIATIKQNSYRLLRLINNLIDMTRIETGYYTLNLHNDNIISVVEDITISVAQYIEDKGASLIFDTEVEELMLACDPDKIERIMLNLLSNATKYTSAEGEIKVTMTADQDKVRVSVKDNGIGIPKENLKNVFERFIQVDNSLTRKCEGSGIGLSLVKSLVEMHGGSIWVESEIDKGTDFIFEIPITLVKEEIPTRRFTSNPQVEKCIVEFSDIYSF